METQIAGLNVERRGSGEPLVLLHGIGHRWQAWTPLLDSLARDFDVAAVDLPGFGRSPRLAGPITPDAVTAATGRVLDELGWSRPHVVGNSLGGWLGLELARIGAVSSVTALAPAGLWKDQTRLERRLRFWFGVWVGGARHAGPLVAALRTRVGRTVALAGLFGKPWRIPGQIAVDDAHHLATSAFDETFAASAETGGFSGGRSIDVPVTVAWCSRDPLFRRRHQSLAELPPQTRTEYLRGCGHVPTWDDPPLLLELIRSTVASVDARTPAREAAPASPA